MNINDLDNKDKPRERLIEYGAQVLQDYELLAIMLGSGTKNMGVMELSLDLIKRYGLKRLFSMSYSEISQIPGIKSAKACKILASFEIARRCVDKKKDLISFNRTKDVFEYVKTDFMYLDKEAIVVLLVDSRLRVLHEMMFNSSDPSSVGVPVKEIVKEALLWNSYGVIMAHNHPGGSVKPSKEDFDATQGIKRILDTVNIKLLDHLIVFNDKYFSFEENGLIDCKIIE